MNKEASGSHSDKNFGPSEDVVRESYSDPVLAELRRALNGLAKEFGAEKISEAKFLKFEADLTGEIAQQERFLGIDQAFRDAAVGKYEQAELTIARRRAEHTYDIHVESERLRTPAERADETFQGFTTIVEMGLLEATAVLAVYEEASGLPPLPDGRATTDNP